MEKIRILEMVDKTFLGGGQIAVLSIAKGLDRERFEVSVCTREDGALVDEIKKSNIKHFPATLRTAKAGKTISEISSILKDEKIDILHTHGGVAGLFGRWAAHRCKTPVIVHTLHGIHYLHYRNPLLKVLGVLLEKHLSRFTDALIFVSAGDRKKGQELRLAPSEKMVVVKNGVDFSEYEKIKVNNKVNRAKELNLESVKPIIGSVARLHRQKGLIYLIKAAKKIAHVFPEMQILIVGDGPIRKKLERKARRLGLERRILFLGERKDIPTLLSLMDVFVLPSLWEGLPFALIEAAALGKPVVTTDVDGIRELIRDGETGVLVPPKNAERLAQAIVSILQDRKFASWLGENLKQEICPRYTLSRMVEETQNLYSRAWRLFSFSPSLK